MANLYTFADSNTILLAVLGYHPFTPDMGAFCGGYQGICYPNPTTTAPCGGVYTNPQLYVDPFPTPYEPRSSPDFYYGIGVGNPGVYYHNPGHILGLLDTYARMSYGLSVIDTTRNAGKVSNIVDVSESYYIPLYTADSVVSVDPIQFTENPSKYIVGMSPSEEQYLTLDPRSIQCFDPEAAEGGGAILHWNKMLPEIGTDETVGVPYYHDSSHIYHTQETTPVTFVNLFENIYTYSYFGMPELFQEIMYNLYDYASDFTSYSDHSLFSLTAEASSFPVPQNEWPDWQAENAPFPMRPPRPIDEWGEPIHPESTPWPESDYKQAIIPPKVSINSVNIERPDNEEEDPVFSDAPGLIRTKCTRLTPQHALSLLTGSSEFHKVETEEAGGFYAYEYRSLPELNAVTNIIPIQSAGMRYMIRLHRDEMWGNPWEGFDAETLEPKAEGTVPTVYYPPSNMPTMFGIIDVCFNITVFENTTITLEAVGVLDRNGRLDPVYRPDINPADCDPGDPNCGKQLWTYDFISRQFCFLVSSTNKYTWDRNWHGLPEHDDTSMHITEKVISANPYPGVSPDSEYGDTIDWEESTIVTYSESVVLKPGCNNVRARFVVQNLNMLNTLVLTDKISDPHPLFCDDLDMWVSITPPAPNPGEPAIFETITHHFEFKDPQDHRAEEANDTDGTGPEG